MVLPKGKSAKRLFSAALSLFILFASYLISNVSIPVPDEMSVLRDLDIVKEIGGWNTDSIPEEVLLVNVAYDKQLIDFYKHDIPVGKVAITDRGKLLDFLQQAKEANNYRYIMLDVFFEQGYESEQDSALFPLIASMDRIVISTHQNAQLQDSILYSKAANADYTITWQETSFVHYQFLRNDTLTVPLQMYKDMTGESITKKGWFFFSNDRLCLNGITLKLPIRVSEDYTEEEGLGRYNMLNLGVDLLDTLTSVAADIDGKIVVVGDFENDVHDTYLGSQPGSLICLNAYYALVRGDHILYGNGGSILIFYLLIAVVYYLLSMAYLNGITLTSVVQNPWLKIGLSLVGTNTLFLTISIIAYISPLNIVYNIWLPVTVFFILDLVANKIYQPIKQQQVQ